MRRTPIWIALLAAGLLLRPPAARAETIEITIQNLVFSPAEARAKVGDSITWINKDVLAHTATARNGDFDVPIAAHQTATLAIKKAGDVEYYCRFHPNMVAHLSTSQE
jgi:plastocyanin